VATVLYDWTNPLQQAYAHIAKILRKQDDLARRFLRFHHQYYSELAQQRREIKKELDHALNQNCVPGAPFARWQRTIRWKYDRHPLCTRGSLVSPGGRFNIGAIAPELFPMFSCFYVAADKDTSMQEALAQVEQPAGAPLGTQELALTNSESIVTFAVSGKLERVFDLRRPDRLRDIVGLMQGFRLSGDLRKRAKTLPVVKPRVITTVTELVESLLIRDWRSVPTLCEIPSNGQLFGQLVYNADIEAIIYSSKFTKKDCLAIFPENFRNTQSWVQLDDPPPDLIGPRRLDATNWEVAERTTDELRAASHSRPPKA
jgi:hypothetical protein